MSTEVFKRYQKKKREIHEPDFKIIVSAEEKEKCLQYIITQNFKIIYVYEQTQIPESGFDYKTFVRGLALFVSTSNDLFEGELVRILINLCSILDNNFEKAEIKRLVHENTNYATYLLNKVGE